jgi:hypothetical protein
MTVDDGTSAHKGPIRLPLKGPHPEIIVWLGIGINTTLETGEGGDFVVHGTACIAVGFGISLQFEEGWKISWFKVPGDQAVGFENYDFIFHLFDVILEVEKVGFKQKMSK